MNYEKTIISKKKEENPKFHYKHNPELNPQAMEDIIKNGKAAQPMSIDEVFEQIKKICEDHLAARTLRRS